MSEAPKATPYIVTEGEEARQRIESSLKDMHVGRLGLSDDEQPYVIPLNYLYIPGKLIFHGVLEGRKKRGIIKKNAKACFEVDRPLEELRLDQFSCHIEYESVICFGKIREIESVEERAQYFTKWNEYYKYDHGDLTMEKAAETCGILIFEIEEMTCRPGKFLAKGKRPLFIYKFNE